MAANLFPLTYSPGIQRDGTTFQSEYCTDGQWIRFQRGKIKKIGGMKGAISHPPVTRVTQLAIFPWDNGKEILIFICSERGISTQNNSANWVPISNNSLVNISSSTSVMWEAETVVDKGTGKAYIVFMQTNNAVNINQNSQSLFYSKEIITALNGVATTNALTGVNSLINGGLVFAAPYLFLYGSNGLVQHSQSANPFTFTGGDSGSFNISTDKVVFGRPIRGGSNSPSLLFWTLSSVVRVTNIGTATVEFRTDVISNSSSILSSKCVVEYDGLFFWPGTDRFFVYNGIVQEMDNRMNLNYFFDNIDMGRRQQVFGVKNTKYGEIWWFYPVKNVVGDNSRAIVYNKRENFWYDTAISRTAGVFSSDFGFMSTYGKFLVGGTPSDYNIWRHETGIKQNAAQGGGRGIAVIPSSFTTPIFSWTAFPPKLNKGANSSQLLNRWIELQRIEPDFVPANNVISKFQVIVNTREYAQSPTINSAPIAFDSTTGKVDVRVQGRNMSFTFSSGDDFEIGHIMLLLGIGDAR